MTVPRPPPGPFHIQFAGALRVPAGVSVIEMDGLDSSAADIAALRARGLWVACYLSAGSVEDWRDDAALFPAEVVGQPMDGWLGERWLDVRSDTVLRVLQTRIEGLAAKGCQGVEFDNVNGYTHDTGFPLSRAQQVDFTRALALRATALGLSPGLKNVPELAAILEPFFGWALNEQCVTYRECAAYRVFVRAGKPVYVLEYGETPFARVCAEAGRLGIQAQVKRLALTSWSRRCSA